MKTSWKILVLLCICLSAAYANFYDKGAVEIVPLPSNSVDNSMFGNLRFSYRVSNHSQVNKKVSIEVIASRTNLSAVKSCQVPAGESTVMQFCLPKISRRWYYTTNFDVAIIIDGKRYEDSSKVLASSSFNGSGNNMGAIALCSNAIPSDDFEAIFGEYGEHNGYSEKKYSFNRSPIDVSQWSRNSNDYMNYRVIWISTDDVMPPEVQKALRKWVVGGGTLVKCALDKWPEDVKHDGHYVNAQNLGLGYVVTFKPYHPKRTEDVNKYVQDLKDNSRRYGTKEKELQVPQCINQSIRKYASVIMISRMLSCENDSTSFSFESPDAPMGLLVFIMTCFVILVAPVNYVFLKRRNKTSLMVVTVPIISLVFCMLVLLFVTITAGFVSNGRILAFTYLDQTEKITSTGAGVSLLVPNMTRKNLVFDTDDNVNFKEEVPVHVLDRPGMVVDSDVIPVRVPLNYSVHTLRDCNERLRFIEKDGGYECVNGLSVPLDNICFRDAKGRFFFVDHIAEGQRARLVEDTASLRNIPLRNNGQVDVMKTIVNYEMVDFNHFKNGQMLQEAKSKLWNSFFMATSGKSAFFSPGFSPDKCEFMQFFCGPVNTEAGDAK